mmetsp:Transcript_99876/g.322027  ORF Transcript_99876/g.322027 Transcript_99876/m.322027 type:complete len:404 (+) Transcript_99876:606-1817(+)
MFGRGHRAAGCGMLPFVVHQGLHRSLDRIRQLPLQALQVLALQADGPPELLQVHTLLHALGPELDQVLNLPVHCVATRLQHREAVLHCRDVARRKLLEARPDRVNLRAHLLARASSICALLLQLRRKRSAASLGSGKVSFAVHSGGLAGLALSRGAGAPLLLRALRAAAPLLHRRRAELGGLEPCLELAHELLQRVQLAAAAGLPLRHPRHELFERPLARLPGRSTDGFLNRRKPPLHPQPECLQPHAQLNGGQSAHVRQGEAQAAAFLRVALAVLLHAPRLSLRHCPVRVAAHGSRRGLVLPAAREPHGPEARAQHRASRLALQTLLQELPPQRRELPRRCRRARGPCCRVHVRLQRGAAGVAPDRGLCALLPADGEPVRFLCGGSGHCRVAVRPGLVLLLF